MKRVLLEPAGRMHSYLREMACHPPEGYEFVLPPSSWDRLLAPLLSSNLVYFAFQRRILNPLLPVHLLKAYLEGFLKRPARPLNLTYSFGHLVFRREPWIVEIEWVHQLTGFRYAHLRRFRRLVERLLASPYCKEIICWSELVKKSVLAHLDCHAFLQKIEVVPHAVTAKAFTKAYKDGKVKLLFVGSANIPGEFYPKGGNVVLEAFTLLRQRYDNLELVVRSDVPPHIKKRYQGFPDLKIVEDSLSQEDLEQEFLSADVFLFPGHQTPFMVLLEAMSYELPTVATDIYATREIVQDGETGFLISPAAHVPYYVGECLPTGPGDSLDRRFKKAMERTDPEMVRDLVTKTATLIENLELRRRMGEAGRYEVERGRFCLKRRNEMLKRIFDEATNSENR